MKYEDEAQNEHKKHGLNLTRPLSRDCSWHWHRKPIYGKYKHWNPETHKGYRLIVDYCAVGLEWLREECKQQIQQ